MNRKSLFPIPSVFFKQMVSSHRASFGLFVCLVVVVVIYRIELTLDLLASPAKPFDFNPASHPAWFMLPYFLYDLLLIALCFLFTCFLSQAGRIVRKKRILPIARISGFIFLHIVLISLVLVHGIHSRLLFYVQSGLDYSAIQESFSGVSLIEITRLIGLKDLLFLLLPVGLFWLLLLSPSALRFSMSLISIGLVLFIASLSLITFGDRRSAIPAEIRLNPALFLLSDVAVNLFSGSAGGGRNREMVQELRAGTQVGGPWEASQTRTLKLLPPKKDHSWNIVLFIMESVGTRYIFDESHGNPMPMPFLKRISKEGWFLKRHHTTSNVSTKAVFSLLSGLYDFFNRETFSVRPDASVPSIHNLLGRSYDSFLVTPSSRSWYFPLGFVRNSGLSEMHSYENLSFRIKETFHSLGHYIARDEVQTTDFFIQRLSRAKEPFLGIYISFAAHFPYFDYGEDFRIMDGDESLMGRYYNNLNLLDRMIKRVYEHLEREGLLERTVFVIVGDHGQAFGQHHPNNFMHYRYSYSENLEAPAIFYQPTLFGPKSVECPTSHVDLLPTLLDAVRIPYDPLLLDGESLFQSRLRRKYIFFYGHEESISSLDANLIKVQYSLKKGRCRAFDLKIDPGETNPLDCSSFQLQLDDLNRFVADHDSKLVEYNESMRGERELRDRSPLRSGSEPKEETSADEASI